MPSDDFDRFWSDRFASVCRTAFLIVGDAEEARDVAQEAFARTFHHWRKVSKLDDPKVGFIANLSISFRRKKL